MLQLAVVLVFAACLPVSLQQVEPVPLPTDFCRVDPQDLIVFPSAGFYRDPV